MIQPNKSYIFTKSGTRVKTLKKTETLGSPAWIVICEDGESKGKKMVLMEDSLSEI